MKNYETFHEAQTASRLREIIHPPKSFQRLWNKNLPTEIYRNIQTFAFQMIR